MSRRLPLRMVLTLVILNLTVQPALRAQQAPPEVPSITFRTKTRLVLVDVIVTDKKGQPVTALKAEDFTVEENGKKQKVSILVPPGTAPSVAPTPAPPGILSNRPEHIGPAGIPTVLLLDAANSPFKEQAYGRSQMLKYAAEQGQSGRPIAVIALTDRLHVLQQFTSDPQVLLTAIKNFKPEEQILQPGTGPPPSAMPPDMGGPHSPAPQLLAVQGELSSFANLQVGYNIERRTLITIEAMRSLARMLGGLPGRKNVVWLTANFPFDLIPADRQVSDAELTADLPNRNQKSVQVIAAGSLAGEQRELHNREIRESEALLASANIAIYPVDLNGLVGGLEGSATVSTAHMGDIHGAVLANMAIAQVDSLQASQGTMREVAAETGGKPYMNQNEIKEGVTLAAADDKASYQLGYYPENKKWDGKYRNIKVKVAQSDTQIRYRKGYFAVDPTETKNQNYEQNVAEALQVNAPATQISFMAQAKPGDPGKVRVIFLVDAHTLTAEDASGSKKLNVALYASVYAANGKNLATRSLKVDRTFDASTYQQILDKGMMVPLDMDLPEGGTELRLAVLDNKTGFIGTVRGPLGQ
ncbi:MAG TPA: VWA domain-containing protein [Candidatus Acidoferrum sp.]|jgi:VWFA-related protein|nr:VWA domain-containing protein [Candidatus Acidoferrum sp.]